MDKIKGIKTKKEIFIAIYNEVLEASCRNKVDALYWRKKAEYFGKKHTEYKGCIDNAKAQEAGMFWKGFTLKVLEKLLQNG